MTKIYPTGPAKMVGVAGLLSVAGDLMQQQEVGKAFASEDPAAALNEILCSFGSPSCSGLVGRDGVNSYYRNEDGDVFAVPNAFPATPVVPPVAAR
ncbi:hypothetical protein [Micromonospora sp. RTGN7]|uniref:hypothetical protein n=1 Tax=Micromonospora sp. RTGN7 TaxID=3016526 RepID=UPI0029FF3FE1|nr:hypothetical protein [Micromonospora sp. RTGN7]